MIVKTPEQKQKIKAAAELATSIIQELSKLLKIGNTPAQLEELTWQLCKQNNAEPSFYNVPGEYGSFQSALCISVNDEILHGIPNDRPFENGDIVKIDFGIILDGYYTDQCFTFIVGQANEEDEKLVKIARLATETAMKKAVSGTYSGDLGFTMEGVARAAGFDTLKMFVGHGVGKSLHEYPEVPAFGPPGAGDLLEAGMVICVECQVVPGKGKIYVDEDGWTIRSVDGKRGAMFEYMVIVGDTEPEIITPMQDWDIHIN